MSQAVAALSRNLIPLLICITLTACNGSYTAFESDIGPDADLKTADIEQDNAELMTLAAFQAAFLGHYQSAAFLFLDSSDLPEGATLAEGAKLTDVTKQYSRDCENTNIGTATYTFTRSSGDEHKAGDQISVAYANCEEGDSIYNGSLSATYTKIKGLNNRFVDLSTVECVANLKAEISVKDENIINVTGDEIRFTNVADELKVEVILIEPALDDDEQRVESVKDTFFVNKNKNAILIHQPTPTTLPLNAVTSVDGDQVYSIVAAESEKKLCQSFERTLSVRFNDFSTNKIDSLLTTSLNGSVTLLDAQETANRVSQSFINSDFQTTVTQGNLSQSFNMKNYRVEKSVNIARNSYAYEFEGLLSNSNSFGGQIELTKTFKLIGSSDGDYPYGGAFEFKAKGLEKVKVEVKNLLLVLQVDYNGDSTGNGFSDIDIIIETSWKELFARDFKG